MIGPILFLLTSLYPGSWWAGLGTRLDQYSNTPRILSLIPGSLPSFPSLVVQLSGSGNRIASNRKLGERESLGTRLYRTLVYMSRK